MIRIALDVMGGDNCPGAAVEGAVRAAAANQDIAITLVGKEQAIKDELAKLGVNSGRITILDAAEEIDCHEQPTAAIRKKEASMVKALNLAAKGEVDAVVSSGSTGALLAGATLIVKRIKGVKRPALSPLLPTVKGGWIMLIDCGANTDCKPQYLQQFGVMASAYMQSVMGVENPRILLLNNGEEAEKGCELTKAAYKLLSAAPINFAGNCEAREVLSGEFDALVCDGFVGNVVLKYTEGLASSMMAMLKTELTADFKSKIGAALSMDAFRRFKKKMDYKEVGGAPLLGINGCVIKAHGSSDAKAFASAIRQAELFVKGNVNPKIAEAIASLPDEE